MKEGPGQVGYLVAVQVENLQSAFVSKDLWRHVVETAMPVVEFLDFIIGRFQAAQQQFPPAAATGTSSAGGR